MLQTAPPTDQRAGIRPIAFVLDNAGKIGTPVTLKVRPEDLQRDEPARVTVHQTLGRTVSGWSDNFGEGLPSVTISGHTGWRAGGASGMDGAAAFEALNGLVAHQYHAAKQKAIEGGRNPASVKLLFVDMLDGFTWNVAPMGFQLRRSRSRPLLFQYNIRLQAIDTSIDNPLRISPFLGDVTSGLGALDRLLDWLWEGVGTIQSWVSQAVSFVDRALAPVAAVVETFVRVSSEVFRAVHTAVVSIENGASSVANRLIGIAGGIAQVGVNIFRTISSIDGLPSHLSFAASRVSSAYNEALCIFENSLRPRKVYEDYDGLYGASNCSSTTGGRGPSAYANLNAFNLLPIQRTPVEVSGAAMGSISAINRGDPVLAPIPLPEMARHIELINSGVTLP